MTIFSKLKLNFRSAAQTKPDRVRFCALLNSLYARKFDEAYYDWQFFDGPHPSLLSLVLTSDGELIGTYGMHILESGQSGLKAAMALDIMIAPPYQGKGLFRELALYASEQARQHAPAAMLVMANARAEAAHVHGLGWSRIGVLVDQTCPTARARDFSPRRLAFREVVDLNADALLMRALMEGHRRAHPLVTLARAPEHLAWRFQNNPRYRYRVWVGQSSKQPFGYLVLKLFADSVSGCTLGDIVDLAWVEDDPEALREMVMFALRAFAADGIATATTWLQTNTLWDQVARDVGFEPASRQRFFCGQCQSAEFDWMTLPERWYLTMADSEVY